MINQIDTESGWRDQHSRFTGRGVNGFFAVDILEAVLKKQLIRAVKIIHVHADAYHIARKIGVRTRNIQIKAILILHSDAFYIQFADLVPFEIVRMSKRLRPFPHPGMGSLCTGTAAKEEIQAQARRRLKACR